MTGSESFLPSWPFILSSDITTFSLSAAYLVITVIWLLNVTKQTIVSVYLLLSGSKCLTMGDVIPPFYKFSG